MEAVTKNLREASSLSIRGVTINSKESIEACAIRNLKTGEVLKGDWHGDCYDEALKLGWFDSNTIPEADDLPGYVEAGFVTTRNRFLSRAKALSVAKAARQFSGPKDHQVGYELESSELQLT